MDAVMFVKEWARMCNSVRYCEKCNIKEKTALKSCGKTVKESPERAVSIVEKWSAENPIKTRQSEFLKLHPNAKINSSGALAVCPLHIDTGAVDICNLIYLNDSCEKCCKEYWLAEVE